MKIRRLLSVCALLVPLLAVGAGCMQAGKSTEENSDVENQVTFDDEPVTTKQTSIETMPTNGMLVQDLMGAEVRTTSDEDVGSVKDLIFDQSGRILAVVIGVDGLLGMSQRTVAVHWESVEKSVTSDELELRLNMSLEDLEAAPNYQSGD